MVKKNIKYIYLSNKYFDGTVYKTQIIDWLTLFSEAGVTFEIFQIFHIKDLLRVRFCLNQIKSIKGQTSLFKGIIFQFPSTGMFVYLNSALLLIRMLSLFIRYREILMFSRGLIGKELKILKKFPFSKVTFYFDARAASAEENKYTAIKKSEFSLWKFKKIAHIYFTEYTTLICSDKIFAVSEKLIDYFEDTYKIPRSKFVLYPCLSDSSKFYMSQQIRLDIRKNLNISNQTILLLYSGGLSAVNTYHITEEMFCFFDAMINVSRNLKFLILTKDKYDLPGILKNHPGLENMLIFYNAENEKIFEFLNAADFGVLFRENTIMNNVASPSKFAEYILCGLPVIISEGVGDFSKFTVDQNLGQVLSDHELKDPRNIDFQKILGRQFDRLHISQIGLKYLAKRSRLDDLVRILKEN